MFGDCQVVSNLIGNNGINQETLFSNAAIGNPNCNFMPNMPFLSYPNAPPIIPKEESGGLMMMMMQNDGKEEMESVVSGSDLLVDQDKSGDGDGGVDDQQPPKKKRYHRHTERQIQEMEAMFKECQHPDDKQRMRLSQELGLKPRQVKFWFQNRRTQMKAQQDRSDNVILRAENENLKNDNYRLQAELRNLVCPNCGGPAIVGAIAFEELRLENARLREELQRVCCIASRYSGRPIHSISPAQPPFMSPSLDLDMNVYNRQFTDSLTPCGEMAPLTMLSGASPLPSESSLALLEEEKSLAMELAATAMDEVVKMCIASDPLWIRNSDASGKEVLNVEEHRRMFPWPLNLKDHGRNEPMRTEASRETAVVIMNSINLVDAFLDANKWMELFPSIVARARNIQVVKPGVSGASGSLHLMYAEFQVLSPLVPTREAYFLRYCQQNVEEGSWVVVDFPIDGFHVNIPSSFPLYRRRPSGCVIQDMPNGYSRVTWIEHVEVEEKPVHQIFSDYVYSGMAFGAHRWLAVLQRQCERVASLMARNISDLGVISSPEARKNMMRLAQRMIKTFSMSISTSCGQSWTALSDSSDDTVRITTRKVTEPGQPNGVILCAVSTTWLPYPHYQVFDLLRDGHQRSQLDVLSNGNILQEVAHIANGSHPGNCISLLRVNVASNSSHHVELMLQESCTDQSSSLVVYTTVDVDSIQLAMSGQDPSCIPLLPLGFAIVPMETSAVSDHNTESSSAKPEGSGANSGGCLLTVGLQVIVSPVPSAKLNLSSVTAINNHLCTTVHQIVAALSAASTSSCPDNENPDSSAAAPGEN